MNGQLIHENHRRVVLGARVLRYTAKPPKIQPSTRHSTLYYSKSAFLSPFSLSISLTLSSSSDNDLFSRAAYANRGGGGGGGEEQLTLAATKPAAVHIPFKGIIFATLNDVTRYLYSVEASATPVQRASCNIQFSLCVILFVTIAKFTGIFTPSVHDRDTFQCSSNVHLVNRPTGMKLIKARRA